MSFRASEGTVKASEVPMRRNRVSETEEASTVIDARPRLENSRLR